MEDSFSQHQTPQHFRFAEYELTTRPGELKKAGAKVPLQPQPCRALSLLVARAGEVVTREELREHLWGTETFVDHEQGINFTIRKIRTALDDNPAEPRFVETVPRLGYRFVAPVQGAVQNANDAPSQTPDVPTTPPPPPTRFSFLPLAPMVLAVLAVLAILTAVPFFGSRRATPEVPSPASPGPPPSVAAPAYEAYLQGRYLLDQSGKGTLSKAISAFEKATAEAPDFAPAHAALATAHLRRRFTTPSAEIAPVATAAARRALALDEGLAEAHLALATVHLYFALDWPAADAAFRRAIELDPTSGRALHGYGLYLASLGHHDAAITTVRRAVALDPSSIYVTSDLGLLYLWDRRYDAAIAQARENLTAHSSHLPSLGLLVDAHMQLDDDEGTLEALNEIFQTLDQPPSYTLEEGLARSLDHLIAVDEGSFHLDVEIAAALADRGQADRAMERLRKACAERSDWMLPFLAVDPRFDALRSRPDYASLASCLAPRVEPGAWIAHLPG